MLSHLFSQPYENGFRDEESEAQRLSSKSKFTQLISSKPVLLTGTSTVLKV